MYVAIVLAMFIVFNFRTDAQNFIQTGDNECFYENSQTGIKFDFSELRNDQFITTLSSPKNAKLQVKICNRFNCDKSNVKSYGCIYVEGLEPESTGKDKQIVPLEKNAISAGVKIRITDGAMCEVTKKARTTELHLPCVTEYTADVGILRIKEAFEGSQNNICNYTVIFSPSKYGCPFSSNHRISHVPKITAVAGCVDSSPLLNTKNCKPGHTITIYGMYFYSIVTGKNSGFDNIHYQRDTLKIPATTYATAQYQNQILVGEEICKDLTIISEFVMKCKLPTVKVGIGLDLSLIQLSRDNKISTVALFPNAISFKEKNIHNVMSKLTEFGVGGLKKEIKELYRRAFASRDIDETILENLGIGHVRGVLFYGPPGSGKTLLARTISKVIDTANVQLLSAPELLNKYLGESEKNIRALFEKAEKDLKENGASADLHVIIIDEIDAICKPRGKSDMSSAGAALDSIVNQLLTKMDGLVDISNVVVIGMTNRKELIDSALLRPGRFEVLIEFGMPNKEDREEIYEIHTRRMREKHMMSYDVSIEELAANSSHFSGAEIAGIVRAASSYALDRHLELGEVVRVTRDDFKRALHDIRPAYTDSVNDFIAKYVPLGFIPCVEQTDSIVDAMNTVDLLMKSKIVRKTAILFHGPHKSGKTTLAVRLAAILKPTYLKFFSPADFVGLNDLSRLNILNEAFREAQVTNFSIIILDNIMNILEGINLGEYATVSSLLFNGVLSLLQDTPPIGSKILVIGTITAINNASIYEDTLTNQVITQMFDLELYVSEMSKLSALSFLSKRGMVILDEEELSIPSLSIGRVLEIEECLCETDEIDCERLEPIQIAAHQFEKCYLRGKRTTLGSWINFSG